MEPYDLDLIVRLLELDFGIKAYVDQTGGGCATLYAGEPWEDEEYGRRYPCVAGPGWFENGRVTERARASRTDFYVGKDDEGVEDPIIIPETMTHTGIAYLIALQVQTSGKTRN